MVDAVAIMEKSEMVLIVGVRIGAEGSERLVIAPVVMSPVVTIIPVISVGLAGRS